MLKKIEWIWFFFIVLISVGLTTFYSIYHTDPHHWGYITSMALDFIQGKKLFAEIHLLYGAGQPLLYKVLSPFLTINATSVGPITSIFYSGTLILLYLGIRKMGSPILAFLLSAVALGVHTFATMPWADYYAGFFITLASYFLIKSAYGEKRPWIPISVGLSLFAATLFRNTYSVSILLACVIFLIGAFIKKSARNNVLLHSILWFSLFFFSYLVYLYFQNNLGFWYAQGIQASQTAYKLPLFEIVIDILKDFFNPFFEHRGTPTSIVTITLSLLFYSGVITVLLFTFKTKKLEGVPEIGTPIFLSLLGVAGVLQTIMMYSVHRVQNGCAPLYFSTALLLLSVSRPSFKGASKKTKVAVLIFFLILYARFPLSSAYFPIYVGELKEYLPSDIPFYGRHRFRAPELKYYHDLTKYLCDGKSKILNLTMDPAIVHLCPNQERSTKLPFHDENLSPTFSAEKLKKVEDGDYQADELIVYEFDLPKPKENTRIEIVGETMRPDTMNFIGGGKVYVYKAKKIN